MNGTENTSIVTEVFEDGPAKLMGVMAGCVVLGVNYEKYISHVHTETTLKHVKRPVTIRFRMI